MTGSVTPNFSGLYPLGWVSKENEISMTELGARVASPRHILGKIKAICLPPLLVPSDRALQESQFYESKTRFEKKIWELDMLLTSSTLSPDISGLKTSVYVDG